MPKKVWIFLFFIIVIASVLRLYQLGSVPISPDWDEVALGYNAYSIMHTGKDEFGKFLPIVLRSYDDYKPALYAYLTIPFIKMFGLSVFAVRLPSAILGILTVAATFFLTRELFSKQSFLALSSCFLLAISPWHIQFSRIAFEANAGLSLNIFAILFFLKGLKAPKYLSFSAICAALSLYAYQSEKVFVPLIFLTLIIIFRKRLFANAKKYLLSAFVIGLVLSLPIIIYTFGNKEALTRARGVSFLSDKSAIIKINQERDIPLLIYGKKILQSYFSHFDLNWLFIKSDEIPRHHAPFMGNLYLVELPFLFFGMFMLLFGKYQRSTKIFIFLWFLIAPIPAAITNDVPHSVRTLNFPPTFQIFIAVGIFTGYVWLKEKKIYIRFLATGFVSMLFVFNFLYYLNQYFVQQDYYTARDWQYGYKELIDYILPIQHNYKKIIVFNKGTFDQSYMFFLFYLRYDPSLYLANGGTLSGRSESGGNKFANFEFRPFDYYNEKDRKILLIGSPADFQEVFKTIKTIEYPDRALAIKVVEKD